MKRHILLSSEEKQLLSLIKSSKRFPIVRFELRSSREESLRSTALNHVYITDPKDSMELVKRRAVLLESLRKKGLIRITYSLQAYVQSDYKIYYQSSLYELLCHTVMEASGKPDFIFDMPAMRFGAVFAQV